MSHMTNMFRAGVDAFLLKDDLFWMMTLAKPTTAVAGI
jgi:hypothetical protein